MHTLTKDHVRSPRKIDAAMAAVLSWEARGDAIEAGAVWMGDESRPAEPPKPKPWTPGRALDTRVLQPASPVGPMGSLS